MKKSAKKILSIILVICILTTGFSALALENSPRIVQSTMSSSRISAIGAGLTISSSGYATCTSSLEFAYYSDTGTTYMYLQRMVDGYWTNVYSWTNSGSLFISQTAHDYVASGNYYRVHVVALVYTSGSLVDTASQDSNTVYYS
ncbi:MAG: hypothetical protein CVU91_07565 [Firmicutes bacterium HGW-Firmicutes-16]|nr:MAG: hypothetical protein CVU91_07565 [Firmicutes bacterium HGW-Firmicutes-16]